MNTTVQRRQFLNAGSLGIMAAVAGALLRRAPAARAEAGAHSGHAKVVFVLFRRVDLSHEQCLAAWNGEQHVSIVKKVPGLRRWVQDHVASLPHEGAADGIGELWFDDSAARATGWSRRRWPLRSRMPSGFSTWAGAMRCSSTSTW